MHSTDKHQPKIGIIMLNTAFPRPLGDIGNIKSYRFPATIFPLKLAKVANIVTEHLADELIEEVIEAAQSLKSSGATIITTSCGFLAPLQGQVQQKIETPFLASSLSLIPFLRQAFGLTANIGILTFDSNTLSETHFNGHFDNHFTISGIENGTELHSVIKQNKLQLNQEKAEADVLHAAEQLMQHNPRCILLECTNLSPYKDALRKAFSLPVFDLVDAIHWLGDAQQVTYR